MREFPDFMKNKLNLIILFCHYLIILSMIVLLNQMSLFEQQFSKIKSGTTEEKVRSILGEPDESLYPNFSFGPGEKVLWPISKKWIYKREGVSYILYFHKIKDWAVNGKSKIKD